MKDFTIEKYGELLGALIRAGYQFRTFEEFCQGNNRGRFIILRHDVDARAGYALRCAELEHTAGIRGSYYFRIVRQSNHPDVIRSIASLGHEIGYHYEEMSMTKGDTGYAISLFERNMAYFRQFYPVRTICMHGSPISPFNNRDLWKTYDYRDWGIIGEPYFDIDFTDIFYLTDTGRCWNGEAYSVRDKVETQQESAYKTTDDLLRAIHGSAFPDRAMITVHPQRWSNNLCMWTVELIGQNMKNQIKKILIRRQTAQ